jgi:hypothetical protein
MRNEIATPHSECEATLIPLGVRTFRSKKLKMRNVNEEMKNETRDLETAGADRHHDPHSN